MCNNNNNNEQRKKKMNRNGNLFALVYPMYWKSNNKKRIFRNFIIETYIIRWDKPQSHVWNVNMDWQSGLFSFSISTLDSFAFEMRAKHVCGGILLCFRLMLVTMITIWYIGMSTRCNRSKIYCPFNFSASENFVKTTYKRK